MASTVAASVGLALVVLTLGGCGSGGGDASASQSYGEVLAGLQQAASSHRGYDAVARANGLEAPEKAVVASFCKLASQILPNHEAFKLAEHAYIYSRVRTVAEVEAKGHQLGAVWAAASKLRSALDLAALDAKSIEDYRRACFG